MSDSYHETDFADDITKSYDTCEAKRSVGFTIVGPAELIMSSRISLETVEQAATVSFLVSSIT
jgi:hypothetical protein